MRFAVVLFALAAMTVAGALVAAPKAEARSPEITPAGPEIHLTVEGTKQGKFKGSHSKLAEKGVIVAQRFYYEIVSPRDVATGQASGKRQHKPVQIVKAWDASSPQFFHALVNNEVLKSVTIDFVAGEETWYTVRLLNVIVSDIHQFYGDPKDASAQPMEEVSFTFQKIEIENRTAKTSATDESH